MSSATSTRQPRGVPAPPQPWQFFVLAGLLAATGGVLLSRGTSPAGILFIVFIIGAAALTGAAVYRTLAPLVAAETEQPSLLVGGRTRAAVEREKMLLLRSIKDLEFDRAMSKISERDYDEMVARLRARAVRLIKQLDAGGSGYRDLIERELASRLGRQAAARAEDGAATVPSPRDTAGQTAGAPGERRCAGCGTTNESDARFCKACGARLLAALAAIVAVLVPALALAQPDLRMMAGVPRPDGSLPDGTITVRVVREALANNVTGHPVDLLGGDGVQTAATDGNGRATFRAPAPGTILRAATVVDGERLESQEFPAPGPGGVAIMLVAGLARAPALAPARSGEVSIGAASRFVVDVGDGRLEVYYLLEIVNPGPAPVNPPRPIIFDLPAGAAGASAIGGSSPQVVVRGDRVTVTSPVPPGVTPVHVGFTMSYSGGEATIEQRLPAALAAANVVMRRTGELRLSSAQLTTQQETTVEGERYVMAAGPAVGPDGVLRFTLSGLPHHSTVPRTAAAALAGLIVLVGLWAAWGDRASGADTARRRQLESRREKAFVELVALEGQRRAGTIDPAHHRARRATLVGQLERIYGELDRAPSTGGDEGLAA